MPRTKSFSASVNNRYLWLITANASAQISDPQYTPQSLFKATLALKRKANMEKKMEIYSTLHTHL